MSSDDLNLCDICGGPLESRIEGRTSGAYCPHCDRWGVVTTYTPPIRLDHTRYRLYVAAADCQDKTHIRTVAEVAVVNYVQARELLRRERPQVFSGEAEAVVRVRDVLAAAGISIEIEPPFPW